jgi:hypothetical protein
MDVKNNLIKGSARAESWWKMEVSGGQRKLHAEELHGLYSSLKATAKSNFNTHQKNEIFLQGLENLLYMFLKKNKKVSL